MHTILRFDDWCQMYRESPYAVSTLEPECWEFENSSTGSILQYRVRAATRDEAARALSDLQPPNTEIVREDTLARLEDNGSGETANIWFGSRAVSVEADWCDE